MLRRDTYHDYITDAELEDLFCYWRPFTSKYQLQRKFNSRIEPLRRRSGFYQVTNAIELQTKDIQHMATTIEIRFDSAGWTGR